MSHEEAREICRLDDGCVAYTYSLDPYVAKDGALNVVLYSTTICTDDCGVTTWKEDPNLIIKAANIPNYANWATAKCYVKRTADDIMQKCFVTS